MYATLYGQRSSEKPTEQYFQRTDDGVWRLSNPILPISTLMKCFEDLDFKCLQLLFDDADQFWDTIESNDFNIINAGLDPEALGSRDQFNLEIKDCNDHLKLKLIYYYSTRGYSHVAQNVLNHIMISLGDAYGILSEPNLYANVSLKEQAYGDGEGYRNSQSPNAIRIWTNISYCIEKVISFLDFTTKYISELSHINTSPNPGKPKTNKATFGDWNYQKLSKNTPLSIYSEELRLIMALRDETVHNGTIDHFSRVYEHTKGTSVERRFILMPDHENGRIITASGRKRFFSQDNHLNGILPSAIIKVLQDSIASLKDIDLKIDAKWQDPLRYQQRHADIFRAQELASSIGAFVKFKASDR